MSYYLNEYNNTFLEGYYDALLENYDVLNEAEKSKLKKFLKKHKKKLIAGAALLGTAGAAAGGAAIYNSHKNYKIGKEELSKSGMTEKGLNKMDKKDIRTIGKYTRKVGKQAEKEKKLLDKMNDVSDNFNKKYNTNYF